jgi:hypothetical protein
VTATPERLDAITARSEGLTDLCAEHLRQSIRHVQRNCDIDCNIHEDDVNATWDDCKQPDRGDGDRMAAVLADIPYLLTLARKQAAALEAVEALAKAWESRGEHDMKFSKSIPDEDIAMAILTEGASKVENARHIRNALEATP